VHQRRHGQAGGAERAGLGRPFQRRPAGELRAGAEQGRSTGQAAEEQVAGDIARLPDRRVEDRLAVAARSSAVRPVSSAGGTIGCSPRWRPRRAVRLVSGPVIRPPRLMSVFSGAERAG
jgi:hypothetical protein